MTREALNKLNEKQLNYCKTLSLLIDRAKRKGLKEESEKTGEIKRFFRVYGTNGDIKPLRSDGALPLGVSDIASLILAGCKPDIGLAVSKLNFGEDGCYDAYIVDENAIIGDHYRLVEEFTHWLKIYDDFELCLNIDCNDKIIVYRAGEFGCIIQAINK